MGERGLVATTRPRDFRGSEMTQDEAKQLVAKRAVEFVEDGMAVGLGTGTTATMLSAMY